MKAEVDWTWACHDGRISDYMIEQVKFCEDARAMSVASRLFCPWAILLCRETQSVRTLLVKLITPSTRKSTGKDTLSSIDCLHEVVRA